MEHDVLVWLLPGIPEEERARVRRAVIALRLLRDAARQPEAMRVGPSWGRARNELERLQRSRRLCAIETLLRLHLEACLGADSFLDLGSPAGNPDAAWRALLAGGLPPGLPPAPGSPPLAVVDALLAAAASAGAAREWCVLWEARRAHAAGGAARAETLWARALREERAPSERPVVQARLLAGLVAARLERFDPNGALALARKNEHLVPFDPALRRSCGWSALLCGEAEQARRWLTGDRTPTGLLPPALEELARAWPEWRGLLVGRARAAVTAVASAEPGRETRRQAFGALVIAAFVLRADGTRETLAFDVAPALRGAGERWLAARDGAWRRAGEPEQRLLAGARVQRQHRPPAGESSALSGALGGARTRASALAPILDPCARVRGWVHLESEHHLLPSDRRLESLARDFRPRIEPRESSVLQVHDAVPVRRLRRAWFAADDPRREAWHRVVQRLGRRGARRTLSWLEPEGNELLLRAENGGLAWGELVSASDALRRALEGRTPTCFASLEDLGAVHAAAATALVVPLLAPGTEALGCLVVESAQTAELDRSDLAACTEALEALAPLWWTCSFRAWHRARFGGDIAWDAEGRFLSALEPAVRAASAAREPLFLQGPVGAGRRTLARWLHFRAEGRAGDWAEAAEPLEPPERGTCLGELSLLDREQQRALANVLGERARRVLLLLESPPHLLREQGRLARELERRVDPLPLVVPPLGERRDEIPGLVLVLSRDVARREALASPAFEDGALATLWRQDWRGNVAELASFVAQLVRAHAGQEIDAARVLATGGSRRLALRERLTPQRTRDADLRDALLATRHGSGSWNRARAARYLGWDPDTLEQRLRERGIAEHEEEAAEPAAGGGQPSPEPPGPSTP